VWLYWTGPLDKVLRRERKKRKFNFTRHGVLRAAIIESSWVAIRNDPSLMRSYRLYLTRMDSNKAIIKIAKKLLSRMQFVLANKKPYECLI